MRYAMQMLSHRASEEERDTVEAITDDTILYQLEKVDQGGEVSDLFEQKTSQVAEALGFKEVLGEILLPGGRMAGLKFEAYIRNLEPGEWDEIEKEMLEQENDNCGGS